MADAVTHWWGLRSADTSGLHYARLGRNRHGRAFCCCTELVSWYNRTMETTVTLVRQVASNGKHIRMATRVAFADGKVVTFMERLPKGLAIKQAEMVVARDEARAMAGVR
jgi:hypothetical protein